MKKKPKGKQNWFKIQFKKHPYLFTFVIGWPILFYIIGEFIDPIVGYRFDYVLVIIFFSFPFIIFFLWFRKNKLTIKSFYKEIKSFYKKIKSFYKRKKKIFNRIYYSFGATFALVAIYLIAVIISIGGITNFKDRVQFEYEVWSHRLDSPVTNVCEWPVYSFGDMDKLIEYEFKRNTQFFDYFEENESTNYLHSSDIKKGISFLPFYKGDPEAQIKIARFYRNTIHKIYNLCKSTRYLLRAAHQENKVAQEMLAASFFGTQVMKNKIEKVKDMNLKNPALAYTYARLLDEGLSEYPMTSKNPEALKYLKFSSDAGYLMANEDLLDFYMDNFKMSDCKSIIDTNNYLAEQYSIFNFSYVLNANMGRVNIDYAKNIYQCLGNKPNFSKAFSMIEKYEKNFTRKKFARWRSFFPALFYFNGWGEVNQNYEKAYELFTNNISVEDPNPKHISQAYLAYMHFKGMGVEQNPNKGKGLTIELVKEIDFTETQKDSFNIELSCGGVNYNFIINDEQNVKLIKEYRNKMGQCLLDSEHEVSIEFLEDFIKILMVDNFKNPELFETINYLGKPK